MASKSRRAALSMSRDEIQAQALQNALSNQSAMNYQTIIDGFVEKGVPVEDIIPRRTVFTYNAWLAAGRQVRKGETGVKILTWIKAQGGKAEALQQQGEGEGVPYKFPRAVTVFHVSQTEPVNVH
jgi:antirestriction protein ArdC